MARLHNCLLWIWSGRLEGPMLLLLSNISEADPEFYLNCFSHWIVGCLILDAVSVGIPTSASCDERTFLALLEMNTKWMSDEKPLWAQNTHPLRKPLATTPHKLLLSFIGRRNFCCILDYLDVVALWNHSWCIGSTNDPPQILLILLPYESWLKNGFLSDLAIILWNNKIKLNMVGKSMWSIATWILSNTFKRSSHRGDLHFSV